MERKRPPVLFQCSGMLASAVKVVLPLESSTWTTLCAPLVRPRTAAAGIPLVGGREGEDAPLTLFLARPHFLSVPVPAGYYLPNDVMDGVCSTREKG